MLHLRSIRGFVASISVGSLAYGTLRFSVGQELTGSLTTSFASRLYCPRRWPSQVSSSASLHVQTSITVEYAAEECRYLQPVAKGSVGALNLAKSKLTGWLLDTNIVYSFVSPVTL